LLRRFADAGDEAAFEVVVARHASMVFGVCRRTLPTTQDAEDACQATFLILARKSGQAGRKHSAASWLFTTARRVAAKARRSAARRAKREARAAAPEAVSSLDELSGRELLAALDEELARLPALYRDALVLCYLEGLSREDAASRLEVPTATVKTRLERGRKRLEAALTRRGLVPGVALLALSVTGSASASPGLVDSTLAAAFGSPPAAVTELARGIVVNGMQRKLVS
jgi:RNA polymerase sigma factor (sigma-70 family)